MVAAPTAPMRWTTNAMKEMANVQIIYFRKANASMSQTVCLGTQRLSRQRMTQADSRLGEAAFPSGIGKALAKLRRDAGRFRGERRRISGQHHVQPQRGRT